MLTAPQVMARLQLGRSAVYDLLRTGQLASITLGRARRTPTRSLTDLVVAGGAAEGCGDVGVAVLAVDADGRSP
ncbi:helix-turn-helix domain-containing protein [Streptomyces sp. MH13]|uniref:helix-turn-helix domain-containing protein n=1 Tax=Streptomyces sp. MH13 TaxID=3417651 RepID=UPI003CF1259F